MDGAFERQKKINRRVQNDKPQWGRVIHREARRARYNTSATNLSETMRKGRRNGLREGENT